MSVQWVIERNENFMPILIVAAEDDVQAAALLAARGLGTAILDAGPESSVPRPSVSGPSRPSVLELSKSPGGLQFLGLASAMIGTIGLSDSGFAVHEILQRTCAPQEAIMPQRNQVIDLLKVIQSCVKISAEPAGSGISGETDPGNLEGTDSDNSVYSAISETTGITTASAYLIALEGTTPEISFISKLICVFENHAGNRLKVETSLGGRINFKLPLRQGVILSGCGDLQEFIVQLTYEI
jgi:hypothetical protein